MTKLDDDNEKNASIIPLVIGLVLAVSLIVGGCIYIESFKPTIKERSQTCIHNQGAPILKYDENGNIINVTCISILTVKGLS